MQALANTLICIVGLVHLLPVTGALSAHRLHALYGVTLQDANLEILMRHRAVLFGIVGGVLVASAFLSALRPVGLAVGLVSMLSFVVIAWLVGTYSAEVRRVVVVDVVMSVVLLGAALLDHFARTGAAGG